MASKTISDCSDVDVVVCWLFLGLAIVDRVLAVSATEVADELRIPIMQFSVINACGGWAITSIRYLVETGQLPIREEDMDKLVTGVSGMESFLRFRDLPGFCRDRQLTQSLAQSSHIINRAQGLIINTFEELEGPILAHIRTRCPNIYSIGPMHTLLELKLKLTNKQLSYQSNSNSVFQTDRNCMTWLDAQPLNSVIYVSFGSVSVMTRDQLLEFWYGLVNSKKRFLFVIRPGLLYKDDNEVDGNNNNNNIVADLMEGKEYRGRVVEWTPQEEVLEHPAVGGFLTQGGWNSTLESIIAGVPMICWPCQAEQYVTSRYVSEVWKIGMDMKDVCDRNIVEKMVNDVMGERRDEFVRAIDEIRRMAIECVGEEGSSYSNFDRLVEDIYKINNKPSMPSETRTD
ncbi:hypothetical protein FNV43_RR08081 [Rhamnella rubrinervis]|uniref:Glycosyltransferase n=1 Tax=Rhamnella rubrinervis TaxID=2594499 RepID=A0A8K0MNL5_9ROSA|nr:hypothetical protein FNV43_RR08081 [Rhamnella rubrinervis]